MKRLASRSTWWHTLPHKSEPAVNAAVRRGQPWIILASTFARGKARSVSLAEGGELIERRIRTEPERFAAVLGGRPRARCRHRAGVAQVSGTATNSRACSRSRRRWAESKPPFL